MLISALCWCEATQAYIPDVQKINEMANMKKQILVELLGSKDAGYRNCVTV